MGNPYYQPDTYAKIILADWPALVKLIAEHTALSKEKLQEDFSSSEILLTDRQFKDAFNGPYQAFYHMYLSAYSVISRLRLELSVTQTDIFKDKRSESIEAARLPETLQDNVTLQDLKHAQDELEENLSTQVALWKEAIENWNLSLLAHFDSAGLKLAELETQDLYSQEPVSELVERYINLGIKPPKIRKGILNFREYYYLKLYLTVHSALSRQHKSHEESDIKVILKKFKSPLDQILKEEKKILQEDQKQIDVLMQPFNQYVKP